MICENHRLKDVHSIVQQSKFANDTHPIYEVILFQCFKANDSFGAATT